MKKNKNTRAKILKTGRSSRTQRLSSTWLKSVELTADQTVYFVQSNTCLDGWKYVRRINTGSATLTFPDTGSPGGVDGTPPPSPPTDPENKAAPWRGYGFTNGIGDPFTITTAQFNYYTFFEPKLNPKLIDGGMLQRLEPTLISSPAITNFSGVWSFDSTKSKVTANGLAYAMIGVASIKGASLGLGVINLKHGGFAAVGVLKMAQRTRVTAPMTLPEAASYCFEIDIDRRSGQTNFWINDKGLNMGVLKGFESGAHGFALSVGAVCPNDHVLSGRFSDCAFAIDGKWKQAKFTTERQSTNFAPHHDSQIVAGNCVSYRDLRTAVI